MPRDARRYHPNWENTAPGLTEAQIEAFYAGVNKIIQNRGKPEPICRTAEFRAVLLKRRRKA